MTLAIIARAFGLAFTYWEQASLDSNVRLWAPLRSLDDGPTDCQGSKLIVIALDDTDRTLPDLGRFRRAIAARRRMGSALSDREKN